MSLQNRVDPSGHLFCHQAHTATLMGNRGRLHKAHSIVRERSAEIRWISCTMREVFGKRTLMSESSYTELFFLDEATALAAGHRPCAQCRRSAFLAFARAWDAAKLSPHERASAKSIDESLDVERRSSPIVIGALSTFPIHSMVRFPGASDVHLVAAGHRLLRWSLDGYVKGPAVSSQVEMQAVTCELMRRVLMTGYVPLVHPSASLALTTRI